MSEGDEPVNEHEKPEKPVVGGGPAEPLGVLSDAELTILEEQGTKGINLEKARRMRDAEETPAGTRVRLFELIEKWERAQREEEKELLLGRLEGEDLDLVWSQALAVYPAEVVGKWVQEAAVIRAEWEQAEPEGGHLGLQKGEGA